MKKKLMAGLATGLFLMATAGMAQALTISVGDVDAELARTNLPNVGDATVLDWVNTEVGSSYQTVNRIEFNGENNNGWSLVDGETSIFAHNIDHDPHYAHFMVKSGNVTEGDLYREWLFQNNPSYSWAVIDLDAMGFEKTDNIGGISFLATFENGTPENGTPVPEPATMLLLGAGVAGLVGVGRRRIKQG